jgi:hypothetical protein
LWTILRIVDDGFLFVLTIIIEASGVASADAVLTPVLDVVRRAHGCEVCGPYVTANGR